MRGAILVLTLTLSPVAGWTAGVWHASMNTRPQVAADEVQSPSTLPVDSDTPGTTSDEDATPAVATYTSDDDGVVYEEHSPQTEVARLRAPVG